MVVRTIIELADAIDLTVVAEGVETVPQASALAAIGCDCLQGFLVARPMPISEALAFERWPGAESPERLAAPSPALA